MLSLCGKLECALCLLSFVAVECGRYGLSYIQKAVK